MKILSMQATFGKLENQVITFKPGLNLIHAPNEWGKSTWCAFIAAMLYGIDTRERTTQMTLADKERYMPWSGRPMTGRMDLEWKGQNITIERSTKGRSIFGVFKAYETQSGLPIESLTSENCGLVLLGVEKSVFLKSAFIRQNDLPVSQDEALRRRLNALVTTGDESGASDRLAQKLKELKNACRHNKTGLLPQLEAQRAQVGAKLDQLRALCSQEAQLLEQKDALARECTALENHRDALSYEAAQADLQQLENAQQALVLAEQNEQAQQQACQALPTQAEARATLEKLNLLQEQLDRLQQQQLPHLPPQPEQKAPFHGLDAKGAEDLVQRDIWQYEALNNKKQYIPYFLLFALGLILSVILAVLPQTKDWFMLPILAGGGMLIIKRLPHIDDRKKRIELEYKYGSDNTALWRAAAQAHIQALEDHKAALRAYESQYGTHQEEKETLLQQITALTQGVPISGARKYWMQVLAQHQALEEAKRTVKQAQAHAQALQSVVRVAQPAKHPDSLSYSAAETQQRLAEALTRQQQLQQLLGQTQGQAEALGNEAQLQEQLDALQQRIEKLEAMNEAIVLAQETLTEAAMELQRQFAPRISNRAGGLFAQLTGGRYNRLTLDRELSLQTATEDENTLRSWLWRSNGTIDQLYLALRLAVAEALTPESPVILDDALVQFDEDRMAKALQILKELSIHRQVILFSCQKREIAWENE